MLAAIDRLTRCAGLSRESSRRLGGVGRQLRAVIAQRGKLNRSEAKCITSSKSEAGEHLAPCRGTAIDADDEDWYR